MGLIFLLAFFFGFLVVQKVDQGNGGKEGFVCRRVTVRPTMG